jgi:hypothetical protein
MIPAYLIRAAIDWVRHNQEFEALSPYARCQESIKVVSQLFAEQIGKVDSVLVESATIAAYWAEFFHNEEPDKVEQEWRNGLTKASSQHDSFDSWQEWFKSKFAKAYKDDNIWIGLLMTSWAHTHQYEVMYTEDDWEFEPAQSYLPTEQMWRIESHMEIVAAIIREIWQTELAAYRELGFNINEQNISYLGKAECIGFDTKKYEIQWPPAVHKENEIIELADIVADTILPAGDNWYRQLDNVIFTDNYLDVTALCNRAVYMLKSRRRLYELSIHADAETARMRASAEGWLVPKKEILAG